LPAAEPGLRLVLLAGYAFAAFAKLNSAFLDPMVSCAAFFADQTSRSLLGPPIPPGSTAAAVAVVGTVAVELSIPVLLVLSRTRPFGVALGLAFHTLISFDLGQHFYDFTAVLVALFLLFLPPSFAARLAGRLRRLPEGLRDVLGASGVAAALVLVALAVGGPAPLLPFVAFPAWAAYALTLLAAVLVGLRRRGTVTWPPPGMAWRPTPMAAVVVALALVNGVLPYLGVKTAYGYTMYSNLALADGRSNHLLVPGAVQLRDEDLVVIVRSDDARLAAYAEQGWALPVPNLVAFAAEHPDVRAELSVASGSPREVRIGDLVPADVPSWWRWAPLRAVDMQAPARCQAVFLPLL
jgi:hypothetical protein